jgi:beta-galactosidase
MSKKHFIPVFALLLLLQTAAAQSPRTILNFNSGWKFYLGNDSNAISPYYNDAKWRSLNLPHDWSIESNFIKDAPATNQGGSLPGGIGWYRKKFTVPASAKDKNVSIEFDGVYKNSEVWINGNYLGKRPYGYSNFSYDLTPYLFFDKQNIITVKVDNSQQPDSRWYTGSGIYRDVQLVIKEKINLNNIFIITEQAKGSGFNIKMFSEINTKPGGGNFKIRYSILDAASKEIASFTSEQVIISHIPNFRPAFKDKTKTLIYRFADTAAIHINTPVLWSVNNPGLYKLVTKIFENNILCDSVSTTFGIRSFQFDAQKGFFLNNQPLKIKGVCMHHDLGALGAAFNKTAARRQLQLLKDMGCNAIRFSHNPPASAMLDLCDEMGFLVMDEAFDMWRKKKNKNKYDYHLDFEEWHERDLQAMVLRDRNHPSVIMWSIGNEIREQFDSTGTVITKKLVDIVKQLDPTRPVTSALTETYPEKNFISKANALDVLGFNYKYYDYPELPKRFPGQKFIATETASALETRGVYQMPSDSMRVWPPDYKAQDTFAGNKDFTASAYDNTFAYWGGTHEKTWLEVKKYPHMAGIFVWSGFDFLGEPLPYPNFPARSSYYGIVDLAGFPKDVYYMYQSEWTNKPVLHLFPHWNTAANGGTGWVKGDTVDVWAYYNNAEEVELFVNNKSVGKRTKTDSTLHVLWRVPYEAGMIKAVSKKNGRIVLTKNIRTAGAPVKIELQADRKQLKAGTADLSFITVKLLDKNGNLVTGSDRQVEFAVTGAGNLAGTDNGYQADTLSLKSNKRSTWKGLALAIVQSSSKKGNITVTAKAAGLKPAVISFVTGD